jgi:hypothetical protein
MAAPLVNERKPYQAVISQQGDLVTLNEHGSIGYGNVVVIYRPRWQLDEGLCARRSVAGHGDLAQGE